MDKLWTTISNKYEYKIEENSTIQLTIRNHITEEPVALYLLGKEDVEKVLKNFENKTFSMRGAFKCWLIIHNELERSTGYIRVPYWFRHYLRNNYDWTYEMIDEKDYLEETKNYYCNATAKDWKEERRYKGRYIFQIPEFDLEKLKRPKRGENL